MYGTILIKSHLFGSLAIVLKLQKKHNFMIFVVKREITNQAENWKTAACKIATTVKG